MRLPGSRSRCTSLPVYGHFSLQTVITSYSIHYTKLYEQTTIAGGILVTWGEILAEINNLDDALLQAKKGINLIELGKDLAMLSWSYVCIIRVLFSRGEMTDAEKIIQKMEKLAREFHRITSYNVCYTKLLRVPINRRRSWRGWRSA